MKSFRYKEKSFKICGYTNGFVTYGKNAFDQYRLEVDLGLGVFGNDANIKIYQSDNRPYLRNLYILSILLSIFVPLFFIGFPLVLFIMAYYDGMKNFIKNKA